MGLEDFLILGALAAGGYAVYQRSQNSQGYGSSSPGVIKTVKKTTTTQQVTVPTLLQTPVSLGEPLSDYYAADVRSPSDYLDTTFDPSLYGPIVTSVQGAVLSPAPIGGTVSFLDANEAYSLVKKGQYSSKVKSTKMSKYYYWSDFFKTENSSEADLSSMQNGQRLAFALDILCSRAGYKVGINSWYRTVAHQKRIYAGKAHVPLGSRHIVGDGADITASTDKTKLYRLARSIPEIRRIGYPTNGSGFLHLDLMPNAGPGQQEIFVDNNTVQKDFRKVPLLQAGNTATYGT